MEDGIVHRCDPSKNTECTKEACTLFDDCYLTTKREFSTDGVPLKVVETGCGFGVVKA